MPEVHQVVSKRHPRRLTLTVRLATAGLVAGAGLLGSGLLQAPVLADATPAPPPTTSAAPPTPNGGVNGIAAYGDAPKAGAAGTALTPSQVAMAATHTGRGYWTAAADGTVSAFGDAKPEGSAPAVAAPIVGMAATPSGKGYWLVGSDGGVLTFGDAKYLGSQGGQPLNAPIVGMAATPSGRGYWLVASDGGIFTFGDAKYAGSTGSINLQSPIVGIAAAPGGRGYWLVASDGGIFTFGAARFLGSEGGQALNAPVVGMTSTRDGNGYWLAAADGSVFTFGSAPFAGALGTDPNQAPTVAVAATPSNHGYWLAEGRPRRVPLGTFVATCYTGGGNTATGTPASTNEVAVDPGVIPLGTRLWIDGIGERIAEDTGGDIHGNRVDIYQDSYDYCVQYGVQNVEIYAEQ
jgi:3D (Asp-Asp-Asp) domain-containing protein/ribosomal protein L24E